jgi:hypothetical protein
MDGSPLTSAWNGLSQDTGSPVKPMSGHRVEKGFVVVKVLPLAPVRGLREANLTRGNDRRQRHVVPEPHQLTYVPYRIRHC